MNWLFSILICIGVSFAPVVAHASETELREAYAAYQEAAEAGDIHGAMPHAQAAYEAGLEVYGVSSRYTGLLAFNYGFTLNEISRCEVAVEVLAVSVSALRDSGETSSEQLFDSLFELGRAQRHIVDGTDGDETLQEALVLATDLFGPSSEQVGLVYMELGRPTLQHDGEHERTQGRLILGTRFENVENRHDDLVRARDILAAYPTRESEVAQIDILRSLHSLRSGSRSESRELLLAGVERLRQVSYADDHLVSIYLNWINSESRYWGIDRKVRELSELANFAALRREGEMLNIIRVVPTYPERMLMRRAEGSIRFTYTVNEIGRVRDLEVQSAVTPDRFPEAAILMEEVVRESMDIWYYLPKMIDGRPELIDELTFVFNFEMAP